MDIRASREARASLNTGMKRMYRIVDIINPKEYSRIKYLLDDGTFLTGMEHSAAHDLPEFQKICEDSDIEVKRDADQVVLFLAKAAYIATAKTYAEEFSFGIWSPLTDAQILAIKDLMQTTGYTVTLCTPSKQAIIEPGKATAEHIKASCNRLFDMHIETNQQTDPLKIHISDEERKQIRIVAKEIYQPYSNDKRCIGTH